MKRKKTGEPEAVNMQDLISQAEAAELRGVSRAAIADLIRRGRLRTVKLGGRHLVYRSEVESFEELPRGRKSRKSRKPGN
jgi:excisionase family DNA binding protein